MKALVIEDEKKIASFIRKGLEATGFVVDMSHDGDEGFTLATTRPYDAVILDIMLPGRDGLSILRNLRERKMAPGCVWHAGYHIGGRSERSPCP